MNTKHNTMETMYRKVAVSERLPKKIGFYFIISANGIKRSYWFNGSKFFTDENVRVIKYWLEETPSLEAENKELREMKFTLDDIKSFGKKCFYKGFEKCEKDDANSFTAWREESGLLLHELLNKTS